MWAQIAGMAINALNQDQQKSQQKEIDDKNAERQHVLQSRAMANQQLQGMQGSKQDAYMRQQAAFDNIMQKYRIGGV